MQNKISARAQLLSKIRSFFATRRILEVETPLAYPYASTAPHLTSFSTQYYLPGNNVNPKTLYLQTSPEFAMKILLAQDSGDIYQICKAFRNTEQGKLHNPEFTILEWYRIGFDHHKLMDEMDEFLHWTLNAANAERYTYADIFAKYLNINPHQTTCNNLQKLVNKNGINVTDDLDNPNNKDTWLQLLFTHLIEPNLGNNNQPVFIYNFPESQAMLAKLQMGDAQNPTVAERFEVYFKGIELANGFHELNDALVQRKRFEAENQMRTELGLPTIPLDEKLLQSLPQLPDCAGVAVGVDRLLMLAMGKNTLQDVINFPIADLFSKEKQS
jgi:elongation factor P--(R)-beta-lysine ligase